MCVCVCVCVCMRERERMTPGERRVEKFIASCTLLSYDHRAWGDSFIYFLTHFQQWQRDFPIHLFQESLISRLTKNKYSHMAGCNRLMEQSNLTISIMEKRLFYRDSGSPLLLNNLSTLVHLSTHLWNNACVETFCFCLLCVDGVLSETSLTHLSRSFNLGFDPVLTVVEGCA